MKLIVHEGSYEQPTLLKLLLEVFRHLLSHWLVGEGWRD